MSINNFDTYDTKGRTITLRTCFIVQFTLIKIAVLFKLESKCRCDETTVKEARKHQKQVQYSKSSKHMYEIREIQIHETQYLEQEEEVIN